MLRVPVALYPLRPGQLWQPFRESPYAIRVLSVDIRWNRVHIVHRPSLVHVGETLTLAQGQSRWAEWQQRGEFLGQGLADVSMWRDVISLDSRFREYIRKEDGTHADRARFLDRRRAQLARVGIFLASRDGYSLSFYASLRQALRLGWYWDAPGYTPDGYLTDRLLTAMGLNYFRESLPKAAIERVYELMEAFEEE